MKKWFLRIIAGLGLVIVAILLSAPAQFLENQLTSAVDGLQIGNAEGGFWSGSFSQLRYHNIEIAQLSWDLSLPSLIIARLRADITINDPLFNGSFTVVRSLSEDSELLDINGTQSVVAVADFWPLLGYVQPTGNLNWKNVSLAFNQQFLNQAAGHIVWNNAALNINGAQVSLGTVQAQLSMDGNDLRINLNSDQVLDLQGSILISPDRTYTLSVSTTQHLPADMVQILRLMARQDENGRLLFNIPGRW